MAKKPESPWDRMKKFPLWQWGLLCIFGGVVASAVMMGLPTAAGRSIAEQRGEALGRAVATGMFIVAGLVLIVLHFVRRKR